MRTEDKSEAANETNLVVKVRAAERGSAGSQVKGPARIRVFLSDQKTVHPDSDALIESDFRCNHEYYNRLVKGFLPSVKKAQALVAGPVTLRQNQRQETVNALYRAQHACRSSKDEEKREALDVQIVALKKEIKENWAAVDAEKKELRVGHEDEIKELIGRRVSQGIRTQERKGITAKHATRGVDPILNFSNRDGIERGFKLAADKSFNLRSNPGFHGEDFEGEAPSDFRTFERWDGSGSLWTDAKSTPSAAIFGGKSPLVHIRPFEEEDTVRFDLPRTFWGWIQSRRDRRLADEWYVVFSAREGNNKTKTWYSTVIRFAPGSKSSPSQLQRIQSSNRVSGVQYHRVREGNRLVTHVNFKIGSTFNKNPAKGDVAVSFDVEAKEDLTIVLTSEEGVRRIPLNAEPAFQRAAYAEKKQKELTRLISQHRKTAWKALQKMLEEGMDLNLLWDRDKLPGGRGAFRRVYSLFAQEMRTKLGEEESRKHRDAVMLLIRNLYEQAAPDGSSNPYGGSQEGAVLSVGLEMQERFGLSQERARAMAVVYVFIERLNHLADWERGCLKTYNTVRRAYYRNLAAELAAGYNITWVEPKAAGRVIGEERKIAAFSKLKPMLQTAGVRAGRVCSGFETKRSKYRSQTAS